MESILGDPFLRTTVLALYFAVLAALTGYGIHRWHLLRLYFRHRHDAVHPPSRHVRPPVLTVQLPFYNEMYVARRILDAVCALDYPRDRLEIQVLDDSTDETTGILRALVAERRAEGFDIVHLHRADRTGFKAGALAEGLARAKGELVAIFDADFVPSRDFAKGLVDHFTDPAIGMVQARWGHLNADHSPLTRVQSILLDGHFLIEHTARSRSGRFFNFNGTAGIWRKTCIEDAGGWQHDTLTEDLDLSYRAQMRGWRFLFLPDVVAPAELPVEMTAFKSQQHRWAKGSIETARKLLPSILFGSGLPLRVRTEAAFHLTANAGYLLLVVLALLAGPAVWLRRDASLAWLLALDLPLFAFSTVSVVAFYLVSQREALGSMKGTWRWIPLLMAIGIGLSVNNCGGVLEALCRRRSEFRRTPKYNLGHGESPATRRYRTETGREVWAETLLAAYSTGLVLGASWLGLWAAIPFLALFACGFTYTAGSALLHTLRHARYGPG